MGQVTDKIDEFMYNVHGGNPAQKFNQTLYMSEQMSKMRSGMGGNMDFSALEEQAGFGGYGNSVPEIQQNYYQQPQYPQYLPQQNYYQQPQHPQQGRMLSEQEYYQMTPPPPVQKKNDLSVLPPEIRESFEKNPIDLDDTIYENGYTNMIKENTRRDLLIDKPNPWNTKSNIPVPQGLPIQQPTMYAQQYSQPQQLQVNNEIIGKLVENMNLINKKLGIQEIKSENKELITLEIEGISYKGMIKQLKNGSKKIYFMLEDGEHCFILTPSSKKIIKK